MEEFSESHDAMQKSKDLWQQLPSSFQYEHAATIMDVYNQIAIVLQGREKSTEALAYLLKAEEFYNLVEQEAAVIDEDWLKGDRSTLDANLTQTYFYFAQVYAKINEAEKGIYYSCKTMQRQLATNTHSLKDFVLNCVHLADYFNSQFMFAQSLYLLQSAMSLLP